MRSGGAPFRQLNQTSVDVYLLQVNKPFLSTWCLSGTAVRLGENKACPPVPALELINLTGKARQAHEKQLEKNTKQHAIK